MRLLPWVVLGTGVYLIWRARQIKKASEARVEIPLKGEPPTGSRPTGRLERTTNTNAPDDPTERLGYAVREWAEFLLPDGTVKWMEIEREKLMG